MSTFNNPCHSYENSDNQRQGTLMHPSVNQTRPPPLQHFSAFHSHQPQGFPQQNNPMQTPPLQRNSLQSNGIRQEGPPSGINWGVPPQVHHRSPRPDVMGFSRAPNRFPQGSNFREDSQRFPIPGTGPPRNPQFGPPLHSPAGGFPAIQGQRSNMPQHRLPVPSIPQSHLKPPHVSDAAHSQIHSDYNPGMNVHSIQQGSIRSSCPSQEYNSKISSFNVNNSGAVQSHVKNMSHLNVPPHMGDGIAFPKNHSASRNVYSQSNHSIDHSQSKLRPGYRQPINAVFLHGKCDNSESMLELTRNDNKDRIIEEKHMESEDHIWLRNWLKSKTLLTQSDKEVDQNNKLTFPQARSLVRESITLVGKLKYVIEELKEDGLHEDTKSDKINHAETLKVRLEEIRSKLNNVEVQNHLSAKFEQRKKMRERRKEKRRLQHEEKLEEEVQRKKKHEEIDKWQQGIYDKIQEEKREKELKTIADKTLQEVNRKMNDVNKGLQLLEGLTKLREVRKDSMQRKGLYPPKDSGPMFEARLAIQKHALEKRKQVCEAEKGLLEVMLKTEQEECKEYEEQEIKRNKEEKEQEMEAILREHLFGKETTPEPGDPMYGFWLFYSTANQNPEGLCTIREQWDYYLSHESTSEGSCLPSTWVVPSEPSSEVWAAVLKS